MTIQINLQLVVASVLVAVFASFVALSLVNNFAETKGRIRGLWLLFGALTMGIGIWSMHFVGMLAYEMPGMPMGYNVPLMVISMAVSIFASGLAFLIISQKYVSKPSLISGGIAMAAAISGMHYIGMFSMRMAASIVWNLPLVLLSIGIALVASYVALFILIAFRDNDVRFAKTLLASTVMGLAVAGMHYTGMYAATFVYSDEIVIDRDQLIVSDWLVPLIIASSVFLLAMALVSSITHRVLLRRSRLANALLGRSEEKFRRLVEAVKDYAIFMLDENGLVTTWNHGAERITGYHEREILGRPCSVLFAHKDLDSRSLDFGFKIALEHGQYEGDSEMRRKDGTAFWANATTMPTTGDDGAFCGYSIILRDISELKESARRLREVNEELEERVKIRTLELEKAKLQAEGANAIKTAFLANMSHEIRTPLGAVIGFSDLLISDELANADREHYIEVIKRNGQLLSNIINDILDLSKVEAGKLELEIAEVPFSEILNEIRSILGLEAAAKGIELYIKPNLNVPEHIRTDALRLRQILFNIVGNAIKFTSRGEVVVTIEFIEPTLQIVFTVSDTGEGISLEQQQRIFQPFVQADVSTTRKFGGTGLGLVLSKKLANMLHGDVVLKESTLGVGSVFEVSITLPESQKTILRGIAERRGIEVERRTNYGLEDLKVLVADDSQDNLALIQHILRLAKVEVVTVSNGREAVERALREDFNIVLMDIQMPVMDGYEATEKLRQSGFQKPIIALTAHAMGEERKRSLASGFDDHITKPIDKNYLLKRLSHFQAEQRYAH